MPGRVRRLLRQRADKDIPAGARIDTSEVEETAALIDFVAVCRTYASELAINEVTLRTYSDLQHYVEQSTEALVQSLRGGDTKARAYRQMQVKAAIRFCEVLFGHDYASLMSRAAENAVTGERKPQPRAPARIGKAGSGFPKSIMLKQKAPGPLTVRGSVRLPWRTGFLRDFGRYVAFLIQQLSIAGLAAGGVKRRIGAS